MSRWHTFVSAVACKFCWPTGCCLGRGYMFLLRTLVLWIGCGVVSFVAGRLFGADEAPAPRRANRIVTLEFVEPRLEATSLSLKEPQL